MQTLQNKNGGAVTEDQAELFTVVKDGYGLETKIANLDHPHWAPYEGVVKIEATKIDQSKTRNTNIKTVNDKATGAIFGILIGVDRITKDFNWQQINLTELGYFDLSDKIQRRRYIVLSRHSKMEGSPNQVGKPVFRIIDQEKKASNYIESVSARKRSIEIVDNLTFEQMVEIAPAFGIRPESNSEIMLRAEIMKIGYDSHDKFLKVWDNPDRVGMVVFKSALKFGMITFHQEPNRVGYYYESQPLGQTESAAYKYLTDHVQLLSAIKTNIKERESNTTYSFNPIKPKFSDPVSELKAVNDAQQKELEDLKKKLASMQEKNSDVPTPPKMEEQEEYPGERKELSDKAKALRIKATHLMGLQTLRDRVKEEHNKLHS